MTSSEAAAMRAQWAIVRAIEKSGTHCKDCPRFNRGTGCSLGTHKDDHPQDCPGFEDKDR